MKSIKKLTTLFINGVEKLKSTSIKIRQDNTIINGNSAVNINTLKINGEYIDTSSFKEINITIDGDVHSLECNIGNVTVNGNCKIVDVLQGDVIVNGDIKNQLDVGQGNVTCDNIEGKVNITQGNLNA